MENFNFSVPATRSNFNESTMLSIFRPSSSDIGITNDMPPEQIADIFSEKLIISIKEQFEESKRIYEENER